MGDLRDFYSVDDKPNSGVDVLPAGQYAVKITECGWKQTKSGNGEYLQADMMVLEGEHTGKFIVDRFNLKNPSKQAVQIARGQFASLRQALGLVNPKDPVELTGIRFQVIIRREKRKDDPSKMENRIQRYIPKGQTATTPQQNHGTPPYERNNPPVTAPVADEAPPW